MSGKDITRRDFLKYVAALGLSLVTAPGLAEDTVDIAIQETTETKTAGVSGNLPAAQAPSLVSKIRGEDPRKMVRAAVDMIGGMSSFVKKGDVVVVKPNIGWAMTPEFAATTNPEIVAEVVRMALEAGAREVKVFDRPCERPEICYRKSGIGAAATEAGAIVSFIDNRRFIDINIKGAKVLTTWPVYRDAVEADVLINVPVAKHHRIAGITAGIKNLMGIMGGTRGSIHANFHVKMAEFLLAVKPHLTIVDCYRMLMRNGPRGGNLADVKMEKAVIASKDVVAADFVASTVFGLDPLSIDYIQKAGALGTGNASLSSIKIQESKI